MDKYTKNSPTADILMFSMRAMGYSFESAIADIMGEQDKKTALFAECKWTNEKVDLGVLETLIKRSNLFSYKTKHYYLFSKSGFTKGCIDKANEMGNVSLVGYEKVVK